MPDTASDIIARRRAERINRRAQDLPVPQPEFQPLPLSDRLLEFGRGVGNSALEGILAIRKQFGPGEREALIAEQVGGAQQRPTRFAPLPVDEGYTSLPINPATVARNRALALPSADALTFEEVLRRRGITPGR